MRTRSPKTRPRLSVRLSTASRRYSGCALLAILVLIAPVIRAVEYVEIKAELDSTWQPQTQTNHHSKTALCTVGTNAWFISGDFAANARIAYWLLGTNIIEQTTITSSMYFRQAEDFVSENILHRKPRLQIAHSYPHAGERFTKIHPSPQGQPAGQGMANTVWLAFCSGTYLKHDGRQIPMPLGSASDAFGYSDKTVVFEDLLGLPKSVELYAPNGQLVCKYEVLQTTNFLGHTFPLRFRLVQHGQPASGSARMNSTTEVFGRVTAIQIGKQPILPEGVGKELEK
jgi:hypothetical protein